MKWIEIDCFTAICLSLHIYVLVYTLILAVKQSESSLSDKIGNILMIILLPIIGSIIFLARSLKK
jgi:hypothetical protein